jgi:hypothetical protein
MSTIDTGALAGPIAGYAVQQGSTPSGVRSLNRHDIIAFCHGPVEGELNSISKGR